MTEKPVPVGIELPHKALPSADWADCYRLEVRGRKLTATEAAHLALDHSPAWARLLMRIRDVGAACLGLKTSSRARLP